MLDKWFLEDVAAGLLKSGLFKAQIGTAPDFSNSSSDLNTTLVKRHKFSVILFNCVPGQELFYKINFFGSS